MPSNKTKVVVKTEKSKKLPNIVSKKLNLKSDKKTVKSGLFGKLLAYLKGAWEELKQVRWPTRKMTWELTAAVLGFSGLFVVFILLLDALFKYLFNLILK